MGFHLQIKYYFSQFGYCREQMYFSAYDAHHLPTVHDPRNPAAVPPDCCQAIVRVPRIYCQGSRLYSKRMINSTC